MDVHISEVTSTVRATDSQSMLSPAVLRQIVAAVIAELKRQEQEEMRRQCDTRLEAGVYPRREERR
jgi:hypothetical protein